MKNILVPCDFSTVSLRAFGLALEIAALNQGKIIVLHVVNLTPFYIETL